MTPLPILSPEELQAFRQMVDRVEAAGKKQPDEPKTPRLTFLGWVSIMLSERPGEPSIRRVLCLCAFLFGVSMCYFGLKHEISDSVKTITITILSLAFGALTAGRFAEAMDKEEAR